MAKKKAPRTTGTKWFLKSLTRGTAQEIENAYKKEAARQVGEMTKWMKVQEDDDPQEMLFEYEETLFPSIQQSSRYLSMIYNRNKLIKPIQERIVVANERLNQVDRYSEDGPAEYAAVEARIAEIQEELDSVIDQQIALTWRIKKIHVNVLSTVRGYLDPEENYKDPFAEFEYEYDTDDL